MAILPLNHPTDHQESMFESQAEPELNTEFEPESAGQFEDPAEFLEPDSYEAEEMRSESVSSSHERVEAAPTSESVVQFVQPATHDPFAAAARPVHAEVIAVSEPEPPNVLTVDDFAALEDRILRAVELVRHERQARQAAEQRTAILESQLLSLQADTAVVDQLQQEVDTLRVEREQVRQRVERLLGQLDALEL